MGGESTSPDSVQSSLLASSYLEGGVPSYEQHHVINDGESPTHAGWIVWATAGCCLATIIFVLIFGIVVIHIPWLGAFTLFSLVPGLFILWLVYWRNHREKAYLSRVVKFLVFGMLGVLPVFLVELILMEVFQLVETRLDGVIPVVLDALFGAFFQAFIIAAICEEGVKYVLAALVTVKHGREVAYSLVIYSLASALGLASLENMMYLVNIGAKGDFAVTIFTAVTRALLSVPLHACTGVIIGAELGRKRFGIENKSFLRILLLPILLHGGFDFFTLFPAFYYKLTEEMWVLFIPLLSVVLVIVGTVYAKRRAQSLLAYDYSQLMQVQTA